MDATAKTQRRRAHRKPAAPSVIRIETKDRMGNPLWVTASLVDVIGGGCGLALMTLLKSGSTVVVRGELDENRTADHLKAGVRWCVRKADGTFRAGLEFLDGRSTFKRVEPNTPDWYEVLQLSPNADADTISRVYRMLAFRYHPDNLETGNSEMFIRLSEAHRILSDPEKRAGYDMRLCDVLRGKNADRVPASTGSEWEKRRHLEVVTAAYLGIISLERTRERACWEA